MRLLFTHINHYLWIFLCQIGSIYLWLLISLCIVSCFRFWINGGFMICTHRVIWNACFLIIFNNTSLRIHLYIISISVNIIFGHLLINIFILIIIITRRSNFSSWFGMLEHFPRLFSWCGRISWVVNQMSDCLHFHASIYFIRTVLVNLYLINSINAI